MANSISPSVALASSGAWLHAVGRHKLVLGGAILAILAAPLSMMALTDGTAGAVVEKGRDFLSLMKDRSPGERTAAELSKLKKLKVAAVAPRQRALAKVQKPAVPKEFLEALAPPLTQMAELPPIVVPLGFIQPLNTIPPQTGGPIVFPPGPPGGPVVFPPSVSTPPTIVPPPPPEVPAVPEPSTWLTMLLGFGLLGAVCRRRRRAFARA